MEPRTAGTDLSVVADRLLALGKEAPWVEFKVNNKAPEDIGEYISALANSAALESRSCAYVMWGVRDSDHEVVGTAFKPESSKVGGEELTHWLLRGLDPQVHFRFHQFAHRSHPVVLLEIEAARQRPVQFHGTEYVRVGSYKKKLKDHPDHARRLWRLFDTETFENGPAVDHLTVEQVIQMVDYPSYFSLMRIPLPENRSHILEILQQDGILAHDVATDWSITNYGALLFAGDLQNFPRLARKATRVVQYAGTNRIKTVREQLGQRGYASGFQGLVRYVMNLLPESEVIDKALRTSSLLYPELAVRELIANSLVHQDLTITGTGPTIELFDDRLEITNPGTPLVEPERFIDSPPQSRNERLARLARQLGICEERGSGWDKVTFEIEFHQLPAPLVEVTQQHTRVVLFAPQPLSSMGKEARIRAVYWHACLRYVSNEPMNNASLRKRFGIERHNSATASRLIAEALDAGVITPYDPDAGAKLRRYVPFWADPRRSSLS